MSKEQHIVKMAGYLKDGTKAKTHQANQVHEFRDEKGIFTIRNASSIKTRYVVTPKSKTRLQASAFHHNVFMGKADNGVKIHFTQKKVVAKLIYWS